MTRVTATQFVRNFGRYRELVQREPVEVTNHDRASAYLISAAEFAEFQELRARRRQVYRTAELPAELIAELENTLADLADDRPMETAKGNADRVA
jgi:prevent-host-death family protein